jgi:hypothetical protein
LSRKERRKLEEQEIEQLRKELKKAMAHRRRKRLLLLAAVGGGVLAAKSTVPKPPPGSGIITQKNVEPGLLANMLGEMLKMMMQDPKKKAIADMMRVSIAIEDAGNPELAATVTFEGSDVTVANGVDKGTDIYIGMELALLLSLAQAPKGPEILQWFRSEEGQKIVNAFKGGKIKIRGLLKHPGQMMLYAKFMAPSAHTG